MVLKHKWEKLEEALDKKWIILYFGPWKVLFLIVQDGDTSINITRIRRQRERERVKLREQWGGSGIENR